MKKTTRTARKVLSVFLSVLMILTTLTVAVPGLVLAADGNKYYVKVYVNIYDGSDGFGGVYTVEESTGKPKNYSWATNDGWYGRINMTGFTVFGEDGDYDAQDVSAALLEAENLNTYYDMSGLSSDNANGDWDSKAIAKTEYTFVLDSFPVEIFWMNDENNWDGGNTGFAIRKLTVATSEGGVEHTMWEGLAGSDSETYNYYGSITPTGIHTCFEDYAKNYDMDDYKFYKAITTSSQRAWADPYSAGSYGTYYLNEYANGGVSATFSEGVESVAYNVDYINTGSTDTYFMNFINHSKTQDATIVGINNSDKFVTNPAGTVIPAGGKVSFRLKNISSLGGDGAIANFCFNYTLENVYASDALDASLAQFYQPCFIGLWNENNYSSEVGLPEGETANKGFTVNNNSDIDVMNQFAADIGIFETVKTENNRTSNVTFEYNYWVDTSGKTDWSEIGFRLFTKRWDDYKIHLQSSGTTGTLNLTGDIANTGTASISMADLVTSYSSASDSFDIPDKNNRPWAYYNTPCTPYWEGVDEHKWGTLYTAQKDSIFRFTGNIFQGSTTSTNPGKIVFNNMTWVCPAAWLGGTTRYGYFSGTINVYTFDKTELRKYIRETLLDFAPMEDRYASDAFNTYQSALEVAMRTLANQKTNQYNVNQAYNNLKSAVEALQTNANLVNQIDELTHIQYVDGIGSEIADQTAKRYVLVPLGEHTVPQKDEYIGNGTYKNATNKKSNLTTNYTKNDTEIDTLNYYYWNIEFADYDENRTVVDYTIESLETALNNFDSDTYSDDFREELENAKATLEAIDQNDGTNSPSTQEEVESAIINADNLIAHLGNNMRVHKWIEDELGNYVIHNDENTHWYVCSVCGYELVYDHQFTYTYLDESTHKVTCVTNSENGIEGCGYTYDENHTDNNKDHLCDGCAAKLSDCADSNNDHNCDVCGTKLSDCADGNNDHNCDVCGTKLSDCTWGNPVLTTKPTADEQGEYTYTCKICGDKKHVAVAREGYSEYDEAIKKAEELLENDDLTQAAKDIIEAAIEEAEKLDQQLPADVVVDGETIIDNDSAEKIAAATNTLNNALNDIVDGEGNISDEYKKPNTSAAEEAVEAAEELEENIELPEDVKTQIDELREALDDILKEIAADDNATEAEYKDALKEVEDAANEILKDYATCNENGHKFGAEVIATYPVYNEDTKEWSQGTYTKTCEVCGYVKTVAYERANYEAYDKAVADLNTLLTDEAITDEAKAEINKVLTDNAIRYDLMTPDQSIVDAAVAKFVAEYNKINDDSTGAYKKADSTAAEEAVEAAEELEENIELPEDVKTQIDELREALDDILKEIAADDNATEAEYKDALKEVEDAANAILEKYATCLENGHKFGEAVVAYPVYDEETDTWSQGTYTYTCEVCQYVKVETYDRADYEAYDKAVADLNTLLADEAITDEAKAEINKVLTDNAIRYDLMTPDQSIVDAAVAKLVAEYNKINDDSTGAYKKADSTAAEEAVEAAEELEENIELPDEVKTQIDELREALDDILKEIAADDNATEAEYKEDLKVVEDAANDILKDYATCNENGHKFGAEVIATYPVYNEDTKEWSQGTYTKTCEVCGYVKTVAYERANYEAYDKAVADLNTLLTDEAITDEAKAEINKVLTDNAIRYDLMTPDQSIVDAAVAKLVAEYNKLTENGELKDEYEKPDYTNYDAAVNAYENLKDKMTAGDKAAVEEIKAQIEAIPENGTKAQYQDQIEKAAEDIAAINAKYADCADGNHTDVTTDHDHNCDVCGKVNVTNHNYVNPVLTRPEFVDGKWTDGVYTSTCNCGDTSTTSVERANYKAYDEAKVALEALLADATLTDAAKTEINKVLADNTILQNCIATTEEQKIVDDAAAALNVVLDKLTDDEGKLEDEYKKPDYTAWDAAKDAYDALDKTNVKDEIITEAEALKAEIAGKQADDTLTQATATQKDIDDATARLNEIVVEINKVLTGKPDFDGYDDSHDTYEELVEQYGDKINDSVANDVAALDAIVDGVRTDETATKAEDQVTVDNAKTALDAIIDGITDGSLIKPADFTEVNKDLAEAKDKAEDNEVLDSVKVDIKEIEDRLDELKKDPATNANDQYEIDTLEKELEDIIAGIDDGSLVKPYYTDTEYAIKDAEKDIDNGGHLSADDKQALNELKQDLNEIKNDPTSNYKDNQDDVDAIKDAVDEIIAKYSECAKGNHTCNEEVVAPDCENEGYTKYTCTVCGKVYTGNYTDNLGHNEVIIPAVEATCSSEGYTEGKKCTVCGKITVEPQIVSKLPHTDADEDGVCDACGQTDLYAGCGCLCHNNNWFWHIVYLIIRIIWKVFKIHPVCACGRVHY